MTSPPVTHRAGAGRLRGYIGLLRPANVATAAADVLAGASVAGLSVGFASPDRLGWLLLSTMCLYAGGITLNDVLDRDVDARERPDRPIPSGRVTAGGAAALAGALLLAGVVAAGQAGRASLAVAATLALAIVAYDAAAKGHALAGPVTMGLCRALNLLLGVTWDPTVLAWAWPLALLPFTYITAVTAVSRGEVHGGNRAVVQGAAVTIVLVVLALAALAAAGPSVERPAARMWAFGLAGWLAWRLLPAFWHAARTAAPSDVRRAVRTGVLSLVLADAVIAGSYAGIMNSLAVVACGLLAWGLARRFAVT